MVLMRSVPQKFRYLHTWYLVNGTAWGKAIMQFCWESISLGRALRVYSLTSLPVHSLNSDVIHQLASCSNSHICPYETMGHSQFFLLPVVLFMVLCYRDSKETNAPFMLMSPQISTRNYSRVKNLWESRQSYNAFWSPSFVLETWILSLTLSIVFLRMAGSFQITVKKYPILSVKNVAC